MLLDHQNARMVQEQGGRARVQPAPCHGHECPDCPDKLTDCRCAPAAGVRKNALMVLTHLILNDMMKVSLPRPD
jgi:hypothetical protein